MADFFDMRARGVLGTLPLAAMVATAGHGQEASACGQSPSPYLTLQAPPQSEVDNLGLNGALLFRTKTHYLPDIGDGELTVTVTDQETGAVADGTLEPWYRVADGWVWRPTQSLSASRRYDVHARTTEEPSTEVDGATEVDFTFVSGDNEFAVPTLTGQIQVTLYRGTAPTYDYSNTDNCGGGALETGERPTLYAVIELPTVNGGQEALGHLGWLHYTANTPAVFAGASEGEPPEASLVNWSQPVSFEAGQAAPIEIGLVEEGEAYAPCFALNVWDAAGNAVSADPFCLPSFSIEAVLAGEPNEELPLLEMTNPPNEHNQSNPMATSARTSSTSGCNLSVPASREPNAFGAFSVLLAMIGWSRRAKRNS